MSTTSLLPHMYNVSLENMRQQKDDFFNECIASIQRYKDNELNGAALSKVLAIHVKKYTNITVDIQIAPGWPNAAVMTEQFDISHVFWDEFHRNHPEMGEIVKRPLNGSSGWIDPVNGRVGGIFGDAVNQLILFTGLLECPADMAAALFLHEVGHVYTFFYYVGHIAISNIVITQAVREAVGTNDLTKRTKVLTQAAKYLSIEDRIRPGDLAAQPVLDNATATEAILVNAFRERTKSATGTDIYDLRNSEQLADQFAVRWGAGAALARLVSNFDMISPYQQTRSLMFTCTTIKIFSELALGVLSGGITLVLAVLFNCIVPVTAKEYDDHQYRVRLIKQQLIDRIRSSVLNNTQKGKLIKEIEEIEQLEGRMSKKVHGLSFRIAMMLSSKRRAEWRSQELQKVLEDMLFNPLYLTQAKLQQMGAS